MEYRLQIKAYIEYSEHFRYKRLVSSNIITVDVNHRLNNQNTANFEPLIKLYKPLWKKHSTKEKYNLFKSLYYTLPWKILARLKKYKPQSHYTVSAIRLYLRKTFTNQLTTSRTMNHRPSSTIFNVEYSMDFPKLKIVRTSPWTEPAFDLHPILVLLHILQPKITKLIELAHKRSIKVYQWHWRSSSGSADRRTAYFTVWRLRRYRRQTGDCGAPRRAQPPAGAPQRRRVIYKEKQSTRCVMYIHKTRLNSVKLDLKCANVCRRSSKNSVRSTKRYYNLIKKKFCAILIN